MTRFLIQGTSLMALLGAYALQSGEQPLVVAHRGASAYAPENTLPAFHLAWEQGADAIEADFRLTGDGRIICVHDDNTERTADRTLVISESTLRELRQLDAGSWFDRRFEGTRMPTLAEVLETVPPGGKIYVEIKTGPRIIPVLIRELDASWLSTGRIIVISFNPEVIAQFKFLRPAHKAYWLSKIEADPQGNPKPSPKEVLQTLERIGADGFSSSAHKTIDEDYVQTLQEAGYEYHAWTIDDPAVARQFIDLGARSLTTNHPDTIIRSLTASKSP